MVLGLILIWSLVRWSHTLHSTLLCLYLIIVPFHREKQQWKRTSTGSTESVRTPCTRCANSCKSFKDRASPCKVRSDTMYLHGLSWYHYELTRIFATCERCPHGMNTDSVDPVEVRIHGCFSLCLVEAFPCNKFSGVGKCIKLIFLPASNRWVFSILGNIKVLTIDK